jgi:NADPH:quinone reductase-like Zn-dependent oxidoreductase
MKAVIIDAYGDVGMLALKDCPEPKAGPNEIKVRMAGASINPVDWKLRSGSSEDHHAARFSCASGPRRVGRGGRSRGRASRGSRWVTA